MTMRGQILVTPAVYRQAVGRLSRGNFLKIRVVGAIIAVCGAVLVLPVMNALPLGAALLGVGLMLVFWVPSRALKRSEQAAAPALAKPWSYEVEDETIKASTFFASSEYRWENFQSAEEYPDFWLLRTVIRNHAVVVVKQAFTPEDQMSLAMIIQRHGLAAPTAPAVAPQ
jgi:hypothetical protein